METSPAVRRDRGSTVAGKPGRHHRPGLADGCRRGTSIQRRLEGVDRAVPGAIDELIREIKAGLSKKEVTLKWDRNVGPEEVSKAAYENTAGVPLTLIIRIGP